MAHDERARDDYTFAEDDLPVFLAAIGVRHPSPHEVEGFVMDGDA